jgi:DNA invertase Pin-like site-specific DNA recombinase
MEGAARIPAATYLRMSTEKQQFSLANQSEAITQYAQVHGFTIVKTYSDPARTGVIFRNRKGLQSLIQDVVQGKACFKAVLVYDVSRWGRFQDTDESAHYEFLCKSAGVPVHYCAEPFSNDTGLSALIMKSLKRVMAGEYSRELGVKIFNAQKRLACMGFRQGGQPGYGLRRLLVSPDGRPKQVLHHGERKSLANDHVIQIPGPAEEVRCVREIYRLFLQERMSFQAIAQELNRRKIPYLRGGNWEHRAVRTILTHPKYAGTNQYGRSSTRLYTPRVENPRSEWALTSGAFDPVIEPKMFEKVQQVLATFTRNMSNDDVLEALRGVLATEGRLTTGLIERAPGVPSASTIRTRIGSISRAYELVGYSRNGGYSRPGRLAELRNISRMRAELMQKIVSLSKGIIRIENRGARFRTRLRVRGRQHVAIVVSRCFPDYKDAERWRLKCPSGETRLVALLVRLNRTNDSIMDCFVVPPIRTSNAVRLLKADPRLNTTIRLTDLGDFVTAVTTTSMRKQPPIVWALNEKSVAIATRDQLRRLGEFPKRKLMLLGMNQKTLARIYSRRPVRPSILAKCLEVLRLCEAE